MYKPVLQVQYHEYERFYKFLNKKMPQLSKDTKKLETLYHMFEIRRKTLDTYKYKGFQMAQFWNEVAAFADDLEGFVTHYYCDDDLLNWLKTLEVKDLPYIYEQIDNYQSEHSSYREKFHDSGTMRYFSLAVHTKTKGYLFSFMRLDFEEIDKNIETNYMVNVFSDDRNYTAMINNFKLAPDDTDKEIVNMAVNFLFYLAAFPECILDGVPPTEKKRDNGKKVSLSPKVVERTVVSSDGRTITPYLRRGFFRHYKSDWYKNCKGQVKFINATMVGAKAKTVIKKDA